MSDMIDRQDVIDLLQMNREEECKKSLSAECEHKSVIRSKHDAHVAFCDYLIECVKQLPTHETPSNTLGALDCVERQAAIDALHTWFRDGFDEDKWWNSTHVLAAIEGLPSVQQERKWETCFECPLSHGCPKIKGCTNEQAIEYASQIPSDCPLSAQPERKKGEWVLQSDDYHEYYECDQCGIAVGLDDVRNFCCNCGADMRGDQE